MTALDKLIGKPPQKRSPLEQCIVDATKLEDMRDGEYAMMERAAEDLENMVSSGGAGEERLRKTARDLLDYYDEHGPQEFNRHFGTSDVSGERLFEFLHEYLRQGSASNPSDVEN